MAVGKSWNVGNKKKVMTYYDQSCNFTNCTPRFHQMCAVFADTQITSICPYFHLFLQNVANAEFVQNGSLSGLSRSIHGKVMEFLWARLG